ncbi:hypothetical protein DEM28_27670, partial [Enterobacter mori]
GECAPLPVLHLLFYTRTHYGAMVTGLIVGERLRRDQHYQQKAFSLAGKLFLDSPQKIIDLVIQLLVVITELAVADYAAVFRCSA